MNVIVALKGDLTKPEDIDIGVVKDYGILATNKPSSILMIIANVQFPNLPIDQEEQHIQAELDELEKVFVSMDYDKTRLHVGTIKVWAPEAEEMVKQHISNRSQKYYNEAETAIMLKKWNELYPKKLATKETLGMLLMENKTNPASFAKEYITEKVITDKKSVYVEVEVASEVVL